MHSAQAFAGQLEKLLGSLSALAYCASGRLSMSASDTKWYLACLDYDTKVAYSSGMPLEYGTDSLGGIWDVEIQVVFTP